ncbi:MAG: glycosyltransferase family 2 protein [Phycisphaerae bacterium]
MKLSFAIPAYNEEDHIGLCLASILKETRNKPYGVQIVVVNNASTDRTAHIARSFAGVTVIDEPTKGLVRARQAGFKGSTGDIIANIDADTILTPGWLDTVFREFSSDEKLVALSGPFIYHDLSTSIGLLVRVFYCLGFCCYLINRYVLRVGSMLQGGNFIVRRSALVKIGGYSEDFDFYGEDTDVACRLHAVGKVKFTFKLPIYTSGRRLQKEGLWQMGLKYSLNFFWTTFFRKPFTRYSIDIRTPLNIIDNQSL